jgi:methylated-DNA-[protein]-cysteine S-methyltransferase
MATFRKECPREGVKEAIPMNALWPKQEEIREYATLDHGEQQQKAAKCPVTALWNVEVPTYFGTFTLCASAFGAAALFFPGTDEFDVWDRFDYYRLGLAHYGKKMGIEAGLELMGYAVGEVLEFTTPVDLSYLTSFQQDILLAARRIPFGHTATPKQVAEMAGHPGKGGAAARVLRHNPLPILVPCHRVLTADGRIGSYCGHVETKQFLLAHEGVKIELATA